MSTTKNEHNPDDDLCRCRELGDPECPVHGDTGKGFRFITPPTDTTGSGREGVNYDGPAPETEAFMTLIDDSAVDLGQIQGKLAQFECERDAALAQLEALRRDGERLDWLETHPFMAYRDRDPADGKIDGHFTLVDEDRGRKHGRRGIVEPSLRAAIDSAQRQEGA